MSDNVSIVGEVIAADEVTVDGATAKVQRVKPVHGVAGSAVDVSATNPMPVTDAAVAAAVAGGTYGYAAGTAATTVDVPASARLRRIAVLAGGSAATVTVGGGNTITVPAGSAFDEQIPGSAIGADVVIGGTVQSYYVSWEA